MGVELDCASVARLCKQGFFFSLYCLIRFVFISCFSVVSCRSCWKWWEIGLLGLMMVYLLGFN